MILFSFTVKKRKKEIDHSVHWGINPFLTPSYLLKLTKFLVKISQFEFLVMTEKNIFV